MRLTGAHLFNDAGSPFSRPSIVTRRCKRATMRAKRRYQLLVVLVQVTSVRASAGLLRFLMRLHSFPCVEIVSKPHRTSRRGCLFCFASTT